MPKKKNIPNIRNKVLKSKSREGVMKVTPKTPWFGDNEEKQWAIVSDLVQTAHEVTINVGPIYVGIPSLSVLLKL